MLSTSGGPRPRAEYWQLSERNEMQRHQASVRKRTVTRVHEPARLAEKARRFNAPDIDEPIEKIFREIWNDPLSETNAMMATPNGSSALSATTVLAGAVRVMVCLGASVAKDKPVIDGPAGAAALVNALMKTGKIVTVMTDARNVQIVREALCRLNENAQYLKIVIIRPDVDAVSYASKVLMRFEPQAVVAIGLPGRDAAGRKLNEREIDLRGINPPLDEIINQANLREIDTIAVACHHSHCGMAGVFHEPAPGSTVIPARHLVISPTVNLGAQLLAQILFRLADKKGTACNEQQYADVIASLLGMGAVDGMEPRSLNEQFINVNMVNANLPHSSDSNRQFTTSERINRQANALRIINEHSRSLASLPALVSSRKKIQNARFHIVTFDSSDGGLIAGKNVLGFLKARSQHRVRIDNVGDHNNAPYGNLSRKKLIRATRAGLEFSESLEPDVILMACNTACTGGPEIYQGRKVATLDLIKTTSSAIVTHGGSHPILLGTLGMVNSRRYLDETAAISSPKKYEQHIVQIAGGDEEACRLKRDLASLLNRRAHLPESSEEDQYLLDALIEKIIDDMTPALADATSVWLVCTHYPLIKDRLQDSLNRKLQELEIYRPVNIIDAMEFQAERVIDMLDDFVKDVERAQRQHQRTIRVFTSGNVAEVTKSVHAIYKDKPVEVMAWTALSVRKPVIPSTV